MATRPKVYQNYIPPDTGKAYQIAANPDGTSKITDVTAYLQEGDKWSAGDANALWDALEDAGTVLSPVTLTVGGWVGKPNMPLAQSATYDDATGVYTLVFDSLIYAPPMTVAFTVPEAVTAAAAVSIAIDNLTFAMDAVPTWAADDVVSLELSDDGSVYTATESTTSYETESPFSHPIDKDFITENTKIDLAAGPDILQQLLDDGVEALIAANDNGNAQVIALGSHPSVDIQIQATFTEVVQK